MVLGTSIQYLMIFAGLGEIFFGDLFFGLLLESAVLLLFLIGIFLDKVYFNDYFYSHKQVFNLFRKVKGGKK